MIAGEIGSGPFGYTAVGEQVGMAQRMESVAPPSGVMLSASTARLARRLLGMGAVEGLLDRAIDGHGGVVGVVGPPGIGKPPDTSSERSVAIGSRRYPADRQAANPWRPA
jgi:class 3 adenylate cyclase